LHERASVVADRLAETDATIALYGDPGAWVYPLYGRGITRTVIMLPENATLSSIPSSAEWVVIERWWTGGTRDRPPLHHQLARDRRFRLVFDNPMFNHSVFRRTSG
jgi:hypothetical protein